MVALVLVLTVGIIDVQAVPDDGSRAGQEQNRISSHDACINAGRAATDCAGESDIIGRRDELTEEQPGGENDDSEPGGENPPGAVTAEEIQEAVQNYVIPTNTRNFSLSNLNSQNEASLIISSGNEENNVIFRVIRLISMLVGTVAILLYIVAGYFMIFSQGDDNSLTKGKQIITFTSLGLVIVFGAYMIVQLLMGLIYFTS